MIINMVNKCYEIYASSLDKKYTLMMVNNTVFNLYTDKEKKELIASVRIYTNKNLLVHHNDLYNISVSRESICDDICVLFQCIKKLITCLPYFHIHQPIDANEICDMITKKHTYSKELKWIQGNLHGIPAYIPLHEFKAKLFLLQNHIMSNTDLSLRDILMKSELSEDISTYICTQYRTYISQLPYIVWSIDSTLLSLPCVNIEESLIEEENEKDIFDDFHTNETLH